MGTYRHPPQNENLNKITFTDNGLLRMDGQNKEAEELLNGLLIQLKINNLHQALIRDEELDSDDVKE